MLFNDHLLFLPSYSFNHPNSSTVRLTVTETKKMIAYDDFTTTLF